MSARDLLRDALFGNPPSATTKPSREGVLAAFTELNVIVAAITAQQGNPAEALALIQRAINATDAAAALTEALAGETYPSIASGLAASQDGEAFAVDNGDGTVTIYLNDAGAAVEQRRLATTAYLASSDGAKAVGIGASTVEGRLLRPEWARVLKKLRDNTQQTAIACQGDSNTYGQSGDGSTGPRAPINGSTSRRLNNDWPGALSLSTNLIYPAISGTPAASIANLGFPGDTVVTSHNRWKSDPRTFDVRLIMLGTNDSTSLSVAAFVDGYRVIIEWAVGRGEAVALILPPNGAGVGNQGYRAYANAARDLANEYSLPFLDAEEILRQFRGTAVVGSDLLHFTEEAQQQLGWDVTTLLMPWGASNCLRVGPGTRIDGTDFASPSGNYDALANSRSGRIVNLNPGKVYAIAVECTTDVVPIVEMTNTLADYQTVLTKFDGGRQVGIAVARGTDHQPFGSYRNAQALPILRKGKRLLLLHNQTTGNVLIDAVRFESVASTHNVHNWRTIPEMAGTGPIKVGFTEVWSYLRSNMAWLKARTLRAKVTLGAASEQGISLFETADTPREFGDINQISLLRFGGDLIMRRIVNGTATNTTLSSSAFGSDASNTVTCELAIGFDGTNATAYLNGTQVGSPVPYANRAGYPAWIVNAQDLAFECRSMHVLETY